VTRLGWAILAIIVLAAVVFGSMLSFGSSQQSSVARIKARIEPPTPRGSALMMPVVGVQPSQLIDTWGQSRGGGTRGHRAIDIMAPGGTPVLAAAAGTIEKLFRSEAGGIALYVRSPDRGWSYYYAHLGAYAPGIVEGRAVRVGETLGFVGDTGNAGAGNHHLHFAVARMRADEKWYAGEPVNPYPILAGGRLPR
jgi:murein DD-endopeptidase MepM/ murein hydrolase activator NlpD